MLLPALLAAPLAAPSVSEVAAALSQPQGWVDVDVREVEGVGVVSARHKELDGVDCLEVSAPTDLPPARMKEVLLDIPGNVQWSSADLLLSEVLGAEGGRRDYVQVLDLPAPLSDRVWFLEGKVSENGEGPGSWSLSWQRIDGAQRYPQDHKRIQETYGEPVEVTLNVGSWSLLPTEGGTVARFRSCSDVGGAVPRWAGEQAARRMLPNNLRDLFVETRRREGLSN